MLSDSVNDDIYKNAQICNKIMFLRLYSVFFGVDIWKYIWMNIVT